MRIARFDAVLGSRLARPMAALVAAIVIGLCSFHPARAATPPTTVNYQGVLRDQNDAPLTGTYDMVFRFMDAVTAGNEIMVDQHAAASGNAVTVSNGLFNVGLGSGTVTDGSGPGTYTSLGDVFRDYDSVWLEIKVGAETLSPRTPIQAAAYALNTTNLAGRPQDYFLNTSGTPQEKDGMLVINNDSNAGGALNVSSGGDNAVFAVSTTGTAMHGEAISGMGGEFFGTNLGVQGQCSLNACVGVYGRATDPAIGGSGVSGVGGDYGGYFWTVKGASTGVYAQGTDKGVKAQGDIYGGYFLSGGVGGHFGNTSASVSVDLASPTWGIRELGGDFGGWFESANPLSVGIYGAGADKGVRADGGNYGGYFTAGGSGSYGLYASGAHTGISATGQTRGGYFTDPGGDTATLASGGVGISAGGPLQGAYLYNGSPYFSYAYIPNYDLGIDALGPTAGGRFRNFGTGAYAYLGISSYKIQGSGAVSFVQNHPSDPSKVIVYAAPEGDEVAVYTRGSGKLVNGEARVRLGETFALVTNPDIGLTATVTPRGEPIPLAVSDVSPDEVVVRGPAGSSAEFDYMVWGLRIGFEEQSIVQPKKDDSKIPSMHEHEQYFKNDPALRGQTALARFKGVEEKVRGRKSVDFTRADRLREAVGVAPYREPDGVANKPEKSDARPDVPAVASPMPGDVAGQATQAASSGPAIAKGSDGSGQAAARPATENGMDGRALSAGLDLFNREGAIEAGDVVSLTTAAPGSVVRSVGTVDPLVIGCALAVGAVSAAERQVAVTTGHIALCHVDASYGSIEVGDHLTLSPAAGIGMKADSATPGATILGRAIDPLPSGDGLIRVLLAVR